METLFEKCLCNVRVRNISVACLENPWRTLLSVCCAKCDSQYISHVLLPAAYAAVSAIIDR